MSFFSFLFGGSKYPTTKKYEAQLAQAADDYKKFKQIANSDNLKKYYDLKTLTASADFQKKVNKLKSEKFSDTEAYRKEQELKNLLAKSDVKAYTKFKSKGLDTKLNQALSSSVYTQFQQLSKEVTSPAFQQKAKDKKTQEYQTLQKFNSLKKSGEVKFVEKTLNSSDYKAFKSVDASQTPQKIKELEAYVNSADFKNLKADLTDKNRFKKSQEYQTLALFDQLSKDKDITWYLKSQSTNAFAAIEQWKNSFEDDFKGSSLDKNKWISGPYLGKKQFGKSYSQADERQNYTDKNISVSADAANIITRSEATKGTRWNPKQLGFITSDFDCTSAFINTGDSFRQQYGRFDFKVKAKGAKSPIAHNIWLQGDKASPAIVVASFGDNGKSIKVGTSYNGQDKYATVKDVKFEDDYYIYSLVWTPEKISWSVNGVEIHSQKGSIPQEPLYICMNTNVIGEGAIQSAELNIDWVKSYTQNKQ